MNLISLQVGLENKHSPFISDGTASPKPAAYKERTKVYNVNDETDSLRRRF